MSFLGIRTVKGMEKYDNFVQAESIYFFVDVYFYFKFEFFTINHFCKLLPCSLRVRSTV